MKCVRLKNYTYPSMKPLNNEGCGDMTPDHPNKLNTRKQSKRSPPERKEVHQRVLSAQLDQQVGGCRSCLPVQCTSMWGEY